MNRLFSICIPTYNRKDSLKRCLDSFFVEAVKNNVAIYIADNNSTDGTDQFIKEYQQKYQHVYYLKQAQNLGIDKNMMTVIHMADSKYALWLGDDDYLVAHSIDRILDFLKNHENTSLVFFKRMKNLL